MSVTNDQCNTSSRWRPHVWSCGAVKSPPSGTTPPYSPARGGLSEPGLFFSPRQDGKHLPAPPKKRNQHLKLVPFLSVARADVLH